MLVLQLILMVRLSIQSYEAELSYSSDKTIFQRRFSEYFKGVSVNLLDGFWFGLMFVFLILALCVATSITEYSELKDSWGFD